MGVYAAVSKPQLGGISVHRIQLVGQQSPGPSSPQCRNVGDGVFRIRVFDVEMIGSKVVAVGNDGRIGYSSDGGDSWKVALSPASRSFEAVVFGDGRWLAFEPSGNDGPVVTFPLSSVDGRIQLASAQLAK